jgi:uncharacterized protein YjeT (DUF2065 family)
MSWTILLGLAIGGAFVLEGALWALFPKTVRELYSKILAEDDGAVQRFGLMSLAIGAILFVLAIRAASGA